MYTTCVQPTAKGVCNRKLSHIFNSFLIVSFVYLYAVCKLYAWLTVYTTCVQPIAKGVCNRKLSHMSIYMQFVSDMLG